MIDLSVRAARMGWLRSAPQLSVTPLYLAAEAERAGASVKDHVVAGLKSGRLQMSCEDPNNPVNFPRNLLIWPSNVFGSDGRRELSYRFAREPRSTLAVSACSPFHALRSGRSGFRSLWQ